MGDRASEKTLRRIAGYGGCGVALDASLLWGAGVPSVLRDAIRSGALTLTSDRRLVSANPRAPLDLSIVLNDGLAWSRGKRSAHAVHAMLRALDVDYDHAVVVLNAKAATLGACDIQVTDDEQRLRAGASRPHGGQLIVRTVVRKSDSRDDTALWAMRAVLGLLGYPRIPISLSSGMEQDITGCEFFIRDQGRTELAPGTVTAGADWR